MNRLDGAGAAALSLALAWGVNVRSADIQAPAAEARTFVNPIYRGQDPAIAQKDGWNYLCQSAPGNGIQVFKSRRLTERGESVRVWSAPRRGWNSRQIWAPELHYVRGKWHIYYAASDGENQNHRMGVLEAKTGDPQGEYVDRGMLYTGDDVIHRRNNRWAIDGTVFEHREQLYFVWSGWEADRDVQYLYIAKMSDPATVSSNRVRLCDNATHVWERVGDDERQRGLHEGPAVLIRNGRATIVYSCSGSWQPTYRMGLIYAEEDADLMDAGSWKKVASPVFESTEEVFGVGHCCFVKSPDGREDWMAYHSKVFRREGWEREVRIQRFGWREDGLPDFGKPERSGERIPLPAGELHDVLSPAEAVR